MITKTKSIVLHSVKYSDNSIIVCLFTKVHGKITFLVRGIHSKNTKFKAALFQPLTILDIEFTLKQNKNIQNLKEVSLENPLSSIHENIHKQTIVMFLNELLHKTIKDGEINESLFGFLLFSLQLLDTITHGIANYHLVFISTLTKHLGFYPSNTCTPETLYFNSKTAHFQKIPDAHCFDRDMSFQFSELLQSDFTQLEQLHFNREQRTKLLTGIIDFYMHHLTGLKELKSLEVLQDIFD